MKKGFSKTWRAMLSWPRPKGGPRYSACHFCDTLHDFQTLEEGTAARCARCGGLLYQNRPASLARASAFSLAALFLMVLVHVFPFLTMDVASMRKSLTLVGAANNVIIAQAAERRGEHLGFWRFFAVGAPLTLLNLLVYGLFL